MSIGNDIVAWNGIDVVRTRTPKFYSKFIDEAELALYDEVKPYMPFEHFVWMLWSVKEAVYKATAAMVDEPVFSPLKITVQRIVVPRNLTYKSLDALKHQTDFNYHQSIQCVVRFQSTLLYTFSFLYDECISTIASYNKHVDHVHVGIKMIDDSSYEMQSAAVRLLLIETLQNIFPGTDFSIQKNNKGIPFIYINNNKTNIPISLAHHQHYIAYAFSLQHLAEEKLIPA